MAKYQLNIFKGGTLTVTYIRKKLRKVEVNKGALDLFALSDVIYPEEDSVINNPAYTRVEKSPRDMFFTPARFAWMEFFEDRTGIDYRWTAADGWALKQIGKHMTQVAGGVDPALEAWHYILNNWNKLDAFYRNNVDLKFVNSQLNKILNLLKNGQQTGQSAKGHYADDLRRCFKA